MINQGKPESSQMLRILHKTHKTTITPKAILFTQQIYKTEQREKNLLTSRSFKNEVKVKTPTLGL